jgi:hypothetical protein
MDFIFDILINLLAHRIGVYVLGLLSGGRFKGESGFAWGWAVAVGGLVLFAPFVAFIALLIHTSGSYTIARSHPHDFKIPPFRHVFAMKAYESCRQKIGHKQNVSAR